LTASSRSLLRANMTTTAFSLEAFTSGVRQPIENGKSTGFEGPST
jgi:hypothetical protein